MTSNSVVGNLIDCEQRVRTSKGWISVNIKLTASQVWLSAANQGDIAEEILVIDKADNSILLHILDGKIIHPLGVNLETERFIAFRRN